MTEQSEIKQKILSWKVQKVGNEDYRVIRPYKFTIILYECDGEVFKNRAMAEEKAKILKATGKEKGEDE